MIQPKNIDLSLNFIHTATLPVVYLDNPLPTVQLFAMNLIEFSEVFHRDYARKHFRTYKN